MKALPLFLAVSLAANAAWIVGEFLRESPSATSTAPATSSAPGNPTQATSATPPTDRQIATALNANDPEQLRDALRAAGVDDDLVRSLVGMRIWKSYENRFKALRQDHTPDPAVWWKNPEQTSHHWPTREQREAQRQLQKEVEAETLRLLGENPAQINNPWADRQYGFLSPEKRQLLQQTEQDYNELMGEIHHDAQGFQLPSDREKLRFLEQEKRRDMEALLTPEELRDYDLRNSQTAQQLRWKMTLMDATKEEYLQIFELQKDFDRRYATHDPYAESVDRSPDYWQERQNAEQALNRQIRATIGDERYAEYLLGNDHRYQQLKNAAQRLGLPEDTPRQLYTTLRDQIPAAALAVADNPALDPAQKREQLKRLADQTRNDLRTRLGDEITDALIKNGVFNWITELDNGVITTFDENGKETTRRLPKADNKNKTSSTSSFAPVIPVVAISSH